MSSLLLLLVNYVDILFILSALCLMTLIYVRAKNKEIRIKWIGRALVLLLILLSAVINMFLTFSYEIRSVYRYELIVSISEFIALLGSLLFLVAILGKKLFYKLS